MDRTDRIADKLHRQSKGEYPRTTHTISCSSRQMAKAPDLRNQMAKAPGLHNWSYFFYFAVECCLVYEGQFPGTSGLAAKGHCDTCLSCTFSIHPLSSQLVNKFCSMDCLLDLALVRGWNHFDFKLYQ
jgi:hypothetical protein